MKTAKVNVICVNPSCLMGTKTFEYNDGTEAIHRVWIEDPKENFKEVKIGEAINKGCHKCRKKTLIRL